MKQLHLTLIALVLSFASFAAIGPITGIETVCVGTTTTLSNAVTGGTWSSGNTLVATIGSSTGIATGVAVGTANITYITTSGVAFATITVNPVPAIITGPSAFCDGSDATFSNTSAGGTWSSGAPIIAMPGTTPGVFTGTLPGTAVISYTLPTGCYATKTVTVNSLPNPISGPTAVCAGASTTLADAVTGGTWSTSSATALSIDILTGVVSGTTAGTATISYTVSTGCFITRTETVNAIPSAISGPTNICLGSSVSETDTAAGGIWSSSSPTIATVSASGNVTGNAPGNAVIAYTISTGCSATQLVSVTATAAAGPISGPSVVCTTNNITLTGATAGGTWSSSNPAVGSVNAAGTVTGLTAGTTNIVYIMPTLCGGAVASQIVTVSAIVSAGTLSGTMHTCAGTSTVLFSTVSGGTWSSSNTAIATAGMSTGVVNGIASGTANITYTTTLPCGTSYTVSTVTIDPTPALTIAGPSTICAGNTTTVNATPTGGVWSTGTPIVTVDAAGTVTAVAAGGAVITYTSGTSCVATISVTVAAPTSAGTLSGPTAVCVGGNITITSTAGGGTWSMTNGRATITAGGMVNGISAGLDTVVYTVAGSCGAAAVMWGVNVTTTSSAGSITGAATTCVGLTTTLSNIVTGGTWTSSNTAVATVTPASGIVSGISSGTAVITYTVVMSCGTASTNTVVTVTPTAGSITGSAASCPGTTSTLTATIAGGTWASSNTAIASVNIAGMLTGHTAGTVTISYTLPGSCSISRIITVNALPTLTVTATPAACGGLYTITATGASTYIWSPATGLSCTTCASPVANPAIVSSYTVSGTDTNGCVDTAVANLTGNKIYGHVLYGAVTPSAFATTVSLIKYNPADSSVISTDAVTTCLDAGVPYYEFTNKPAGNYLVRATLASSMPGGSDYIPTYGYSGSSWFSSTNVSHISNADNMDINMLYGTLPTGPGSISGFVFLNGAPVANMLMFVRNAFTWEVVSYTYTDASGAYSFSGLASGVSYVIYPEYFGYNTIPSAIITIDHPHTTLSNVSFSQITAQRLIKPLYATGVATEEITHNIALYPNPTTGLIHIQWAQQATGTAAITVTDMLGRTVHTSLININANSGSAQADLSELKKGIYFISINGAQMNYSSTLQLQ